MPHFLARSVTLPQMPFSKNGYEFVYEAHKKNNSGESIILVRYENQAFFLQKIARFKKNDVIIKCNKNSRIKPVGIIKNALKILADMQENLISHNLDNNSIAQSNISPYLKNIDFFIDFKKEFILEIGFGSGRHLLDVAKNNLDCICIGLEIHAPSIEQVLRQIELMNLKNLYILNCDARILLEILPDSKARAIYLHFPVPWNKKPHRRVFSKAFLVQSLRVLQENGTLHLRSDDKVYVNDAIKLCDEFKNEIKVLLEKNKKHSITSKYEARWERQNKDIYDVFITKCMEKNAESNANLDKNLHKNLKFNKIFKKNLHNFNFCVLKHIDKQWFLHIQGVYVCGDIVVLAMCFGDFHQPQSRFLQLKTNELSVIQADYIGGDVIPTNAALNAQEHLILILSKE